MVEEALYLLVLRLNIEYNSCPFTSKLFASGVSIHHTYMPTGIEDVGIRVHACTNDSDGNNGVAAPRY